MKKEDIILALTKIAGLIVTERGEIKGSDLQDTMTHDARVTDILDSYYRGKRVHQAAARGLLISEAISVAFKDNLFTEIPEQERRFVANK